MRRLSIPALSFFYEVIQPAFADLQPDGFPFTGTLNEFTLMDDVVSSKPIVDIRRVQNILQRRDASCDLNYKKIMGTTTRKISTEEVYGATQICKNSFYQGCLKDWRAKDPMFSDKILPWFQKAVNIDIASNAYFGDVERVVSPTAIWSTNIFDGIFKWIKRYIAQNIIPSNQVFNITNGVDLINTPTNAYNILKTMYYAQGVLFNSFLDDQKAYYVSKEIAQGYEQYLIATGQNTDGNRLLINGIKVLSFMGIPVLVEPIWTPILQEIKGSIAYAAILTLRGNFVFATDKNYGEGEDDKSALMVWYENKDLTWYYQMFLRAGTQIALPEFVIVSMTTFA